MKFLKELFLSSLFALPSLGMAHSEGKASCQWFDGAKPQYELYFTKNDGLMFALTSTHHNSNLENEHLCTRIAVPLGSIQHIDGHEVGLTYVCDDVEVYFGPWISHNEVFFAKFDSVTYRCQTTP